jgi:glycosyltransferase involved in cell wall biosynthesis
LATDIEGVSYLFWTDSSNQRPGTFARASATSFHPVDSEPLLSVRPLALPGSPRVAIVHDWLITPAGSEAVLREVLRLFPDGVLHCVIDRMAPEARAQLGVARTTATWLSRLPGVSRYYRSLLPVMPMAIESLDLSAYDLVISSSHAVAKGVRPRVGALHLCYCHSPMRYAWDLEATYLEEAGLAGGVRGVLVRALLQRLRRWDRDSAARVSTFMANSAFVASRIERAYGRRSTVVHPPVDTTFFTPGADAARGTQFVTASRLVSYKRVHAIVEAFRNLPDQQLVVIGDGPDRERVLAAAGPNVTWLGRVSDDALRNALQRARAFVFAAEEDFGILPVEAQACGTPVIALGRGGARETVTLESGMFFEDPSPASIAAAIRTFLEAPPPSSAVCRQNAERFAVGHFHTAFTDVVHSAWAAHQQVSPATAPRRATV